MDLAGMNRQPPNHFYFPVIGSGGKGKSVPGGPPVPVSLTGRRVPKPDDFRGGRCDCKVAAGDEGA